MTSRRRDPRAATAAAPQVHVRIGRLVLDAGVDAAALDGLIRGALADRLAGQPALRGLAQPIADGLSPQLASQAAARAAKG